MNVCKYYVTQLQWQCSPALSPSDWAREKAQCSACHSLIQWQWGNALGSSAQNPISAESAIHPSSFRPPDRYSASVPNIPFIELHPRENWTAMVT